MDLQDSLLLNGSMTVTGEGGGTINVRADNFLIDKEWPRALVQLLQAALSWRTAILPVDPTPAEKMAEL